MVLGSPIKGLAGILPTIGFISKMLLFKSGLAAEQLWALVLILFLLVPGPATSHAVGSAAKRINLPMKGARRDDLAGETKSTLK